MTATSYLSGHFLIAMPNLQDPNFLRSVTYICEHNTEGAFGIVINRELDTNICDIFQELKLDSVENCLYKDHKIFTGGPVDTERGLILHKPEGNWQSTLTQNNELAVTSSLDILSAIAQNQGPEKFMMVLGYAGWEAGQLEQEMAANIWLNGPADMGIIFDTPVCQRWNDAAKSMGIDLRLLSNDIGHA